MSEQQLIERIKELEAENEALLIQINQKNVRNAGRKPCITLKEVERMKVMRAEGRSYAYIGQAFGVSPTSVYNKLNNIR
jgi:hypothetical protein